jgi:hypothetical protein
LLVIETGEAVKKKVGKAVWQVRSMRLLPRPLRTASDVFIKQYRQAGTGTLTLNPDCCRRDAGYHPSRKNHNIGVDIKRMGVKVGLTTAAANPPG